MMSDSTGSGRDPVEQLAESFQARLRRGERPSLEEYIARCPERADDIRELFPALVEMEQLKPGVQVATGAPELPEGGRKGPPTFPGCHKVGDPLPLGIVRRKTIKTMWVGFNDAFSRQAWSFRSARECLLTRPGDESGVHDSRGRPAVSVVWLVRPWRGLVLKRINETTRG